jgi:hypothetical protein
VRTFRLNRWSRVRVVHCLTRRISLTELRPSSMCIRAIIYNTSGCICYNTYTIWTRPAICTHKCCYSTLDHIVDLNLSNLILS